MKIIAPLLLVLIPGALSCTREGPKNTSVGEVVLTWSTATPTVFHVNGVSIGDGRVFQKYVRQNCSSWSRVIVTFPKGEPFENVEYCPPYVDTGFANLCYQRKIPVEYFGPDERRLICHQIALRNYDGSGGPETEAEAEYFLDRRYMGKGEEGIARIRSESLERNSFLQVLIPWRSSPQGPPLDLPLSCVELHGYFLAKGVRLEFNEDRIHYENENIVK